MKKTTILSAAVSVVLTCSTLAMAQQDTGSWRAMSSSAKGITGDVGLTSEKLYINFMPFTIAQIRPLNAAEMSAAFNADASAGGRGNLYRLSIPASRKFLHKNSICGSDDTQWVATYVEGNSLQLAFFSGTKMPVFTLEALADSSDLCGTYSYAR